MGAPSTAITRFDLSISYAEFSLLANRRQFIGLRVLPPVTVARQSSDFLKVRVADVLGKIETTTRAPGATYSRDGFEWTTDSYATTEHGAEEVLDDLTLAMYGNEIRAEQIKTQRAINRVLQAYEDEVATAIFNTATWTGASLTTTLGTAWSTHATADPQEDIRAAVEKVVDGTGVVPNTLILSDFAWRHLAQVASVEDLLKYNGVTDPRNIGAIGTLAQLFNLDNILVAGGVKNTANEGQTAVFDRMWSKTLAMVCHVSPAGSDDIEDPVPNVGRTVMWGEENAAIPGGEESEPPVIIEEYREEGRRGGVIRARLNYQVKTLHVAAGHLLQAVTA